MEPTTAATAGLFWAWVAHDLEELVTMQETTRRIFARLPEAIPLPQGWRDRGMPQRQIVIGMSMVGVVMAAASVDGYRTGGRSGLYQTVLLGFGLHGIGHLGIALTVGGYAAGAATSPTIVIPFWWAATRRLDASGVPVRRSLPLAAAMVPATIGAAHLAAWLLTRRPPRIAGVFVSVAAH